VSVVVLIAIISAAAYGLSKTKNAPPPSELDLLRARVVSVATTQIGYHTNPSDSYCNKFSAYWGAGADVCGNKNRSEEWCADFAAWAWHKAGADVDYKLAPNYLNSDSASFYVWGVDHGTWHPVSASYTPQPGDVAVYGLNAKAVTAEHVAIVTTASAKPNAPNVINGDGDRTGYSVVEVGHEQKFGDVQGHGDAVSGYVSPSLPLQSSSGLS